MQDDREDREVIARGTWQDCLWHLGRRVQEKAPPNTRHSASARQPIASFCEVSTKSVARWFVEDAERPAGLVLVRLICYLDMIGYEVVELERMKPQALRNFTELIGYGVITDAEAIQRLGLAKSQSLYRLIFAHSSVNPEKAVIMRDAWLEKRAELEQKKRESAELYKLTCLEDGAGTAPGIATAGKGSPVFVGAIQILNGLDCILDDTLLGTLPTSEIMRLEGMVANIHQKLTNRVDKLREE